jgi:GntR family transcriptional regulator/MocR family aminotransferase
MHAILPLTSAAEERRLVELAEYAGLALHGLHTFNYWQAPEDQAAALVIGYGTAPPHAWRPALDKLAEVLLS